MTKYVVGSIEPIGYDDDIEDEVIAYVHFQKYHSYNVDLKIELEDATFFDTIKEAEESADIYIPTEDDDPDALFWREEFCVYEVELKAKVKRQVK